MTYSIEKITTLIGAHRFGEKAASIGFLLTDSRSLCFPEETLFFAMKSGRNNGHDFIPDLYRRGVRNFVIDTLPENYAEVYPDANFLRVLSPLEALQRLAERHRDEFNIPIVGITGSNGKTIVKEWLFRVLTPSRVVTRSPRSYNSQIGVPLSVWLMNEQTEVGVFEAGISKPGEMQTLRDIIQPTVGVLTSLGSAHQENFESMEQKCREKLTLFHDAKTIIYNADDETVSRCIDDSGFKGEKIGWTRNAQAAANHAMVSSEEPCDGKTKITISIKGVQITYQLPFIDEASVECSIACALTAHSLGIQAADIAERMAELEPVAMRLEVKQGQHGCTLINDSYNSDINSLDIALDFMNRRPDHKGRRRTLILSDIYQSGLERAELYRKVSTLCAERGVEKFIGIGPDLMAERDKINTGEKYFFADCPSFISSKVFSSMRNEVVLIKGARAFGFDAITDMLEQKVHETILEVNLNALVNNLNHYRSFMKPETKLVCMVKANAYGAGAVEVGKTLQDHRVSYLAVAVADEGVTLRRNGITSNIMIMNPEMTAFKTMFDYDLEPEVYSFRLLDALIRAARKEGITGYPVHIKLDTGMRRLGFDPERDIEELIGRLKSQNAVIPRSVFSHFVGSDGGEFNDYTRHQFTVFDEASRKLQAAFPNKILRHICNTAGIEYFPEYQLDMCRLGIGLYGVNPRNNEIIHNVSTLKTTILQLHSVKKGESIGYSRRTVLERDSMIAAIPIGYADGLDRHLGQRHCYCLVNGMKAYYLGNICMDVAMIDVTGIPCAEGDTVEIFGDNLPVTVLSDVIGTIPYEVLTGVSERVKRVYYQD